MGADAHPESCRQRESRKWIDLRRPPIADPPRQAAATTGPARASHRLGSATSIGAIHVARSAPDGYTLFYGTPATQIINPSLFPRLNYDPDRDLVTVGSVMRAPNLLLVHPSLGVRDVAGFIEKAKTMPGQLTYASTAIGSSNHLSGEMLNRLAGIHLMHVPYSNFGLSAGELIAGRVHAYFGTISDMLRVSAGTSLVKVAVTSASRSPLLPETPTVAETVPGFEATAYNYIAVPPRTPASIIMALNAGLQPRAGRSPRRAGDGRHRAPAHRHRRAGRGAADHPARA